MWMKFRSQGCSKWRLLRRWGNIGLVLPTGKKQNGDIPMRKSMKRGAAASLAAVAILAGSASAASAYSGSDDEQPPVTVVNEITNTNDNDNDNTAVAVNDNDNTATLDASTGIDAAELAEIIDALLP
jgi:hypothetical protein